MLSRISILGGQDKNGQAEPVRRLDIGAGEMLAVVGPTGSGKTQLISDIEQYADGETVITSYSIHYTKLYEYKSGFIHTGPEEP